jgi:CheY-like chemotaxis protein
MACAESDERPKKAEGDMEAENKTASLRVLVAEDDPALRNVIRVSLQGAGFEVIACRDGQEALSRLDQQPIDMLVTDMQMPRMSGLELCEKLRSDCRHRDLPVLMLTAKGLELDIDSLRADLGVAEVMFKPFSPRELARSVARHLRDALEKTA